MSSATPRAGKPYGFGKAARPNGRGLVEVQLRRSKAHLVAGDDFLCGHLDRMQFAIEIRLPKVEELRQHGKFRGEIIVLPNKRLQETRMVGEMVEDFRCG